jgi:thymidylate synthase (FAD)
MKIDLLSITPDAERVIEKAGRTAYQSFDRMNEESTAKFISMIIKRGHTSVLEHAVATFRISDVSRAFSHQFVRHRLASYTQKSQRYVSEDEFDFVIPDSIKQNEDALNIFTNIMLDIKKAYVLLQEFNIRNEDARFVLPMACTTEIVVTANFREWRHIIGLRTDKAAQWEIRAVCMDILKILQEKAPSCFGDLI